MGPTKIELALLLLVLGGISIKLLYFLLIPKRKTKLFFKSFGQWFNLAHNLEEIDDNMESFLKMSNYCNIIVWIAFGVLCYLLAFYTLFPEE